MRIIPKLIRFANSDSKPESKDGNLYVPKYVKMDIVHCDFTGAGFEWDGGHYGIVWSVNPIMDSIMIIPTTSQPRPEFPNVFSVGQIPGLPQKITTVLVSDMTRVSRKRLTELLRFNPKTGNNERVTLPYGWVKRITEAVVLTYGNEISFGDYLADNFGVAMVSDLNTLHELRFKPVKCTYDPTNLILSYRLWNETLTNSLQLINPHPGMYISVRDKKQLVRGLLSHNEAKRVRAEADYKRLYH